MALTDQSKWAAPGFTGKAGEEETTPQPSGLTPRQERMQGARHPANLNQPNVVEPKGSETTAAQRGALGQKEGRLDKGQEKAQAEAQGQFHAQVQQVASKIGNFGWQLQEKVNQFLTKGATNIGMEDKSTFTIDPLTGEYKIQDITDKNIDPVAAQKAEEQKRLQEAMSPYTQNVGGKMMAKSFKDVIGEMFASDPETSAYLNQAIDTLDSLNKSGRGDSPEAKAAMEQIAAMDHTGDISGLFRAKQQYEKYMGIPGAEDTLKWYGDKGDTGYSAMDLSQLSADKIKEEVDNSLNFSSGLFGGDFESSLERLFDTESSNIKESNRKKEAIRNQMSAGFKSFVDQAGGEFSSARQKYEDSFSAVGKSIVDELQKEGKTQEAQMWAESIQGGTFSNTLYNMLNDPKSGMSTEQRAAITKFIGKAGEQAGGQLFSWLNSLQQTGSFTVTTKDSQGKDKDVKISPDASQQLEILSVFNSNMSPEDKQAKLKEIVKGMTVDPSHNIGQVVQDALSTANKTGDSAAGLETMKQSLIESMKTFAGSFAEDVVREVLNIPDEAWAKLTPAQKSELMTNTMRDNPELLQGKMKDLSAKARQIKQKYDTTITTAKKNLEERKVALAKEAVFDDKGGLTGGRLKELSDKVTAFTVGAPAEIAHSLSGTFEAGYDRYLKGLQSHPVVLAAVKDGRISGSEMSTLARAYSYKEALASLQGNSPALYSQLMRLTGGDTGILSALDPKGLESQIQKAVTTGNTGMLTSVIDRFNLKVLEPMLAGKLGDVFSRYIAEVKTGKANGPYESALRTEMEKAANQAGVLQEEVQKARDAVTQNTSINANLDAVIKGMDPGMFDPTNIMQFAIETGKGKENKATNLGLDEATLSGLGIDKSAVATVNGIPYVKMGDGKYQPLDEAVLTNIENMFQISPASSAGFGDFANVAGVKAGTGTNINIEAPKAVTIDNNTKTDIQNRIHEFKPTSIKKTKTYTLPTEDPNQTFVVSVPNDMDVKEYLNAVGLTKFVDVDNVKEITEGRRIVEAIKNSIWDVTPDAVKEWMGKNLGAGAYSIPSPGVAEQNAINEARKNKEVAERKEQTSKDVGTSRMGMQDTRGMA